MAVFVTGDTHGTLDLYEVISFFEGKEGDFSKDDHLIVCGDTGICGFSSEEEKRTRAAFRRLPVTTLFIDGNHEKFDDLNSYDVDIWNGGKVHFIENNIIHLMRGQVYDLDGISLFTFGGASSTDKEYRSEGLDWFPEEIPNDEEFEEGLENLEAHGYKVDYIITHTAPFDVAAALGFGEFSDEEARIRKYFQRIADEVDFKAWYFGHFHVDEEVDDAFRALFYDIIRIA